MKYLIFLALVIFISFSNVSEAQINKERKPNKEKYEITKTPKSLFLIKKKIDESDFGEPTIYPHELQLRVIENDPRLFDPFAKKL